MWQSRKGGTLHARGGLNDSPLAHGHQTIGHLRYRRVAPIFFLEARRCRLTGFFSLMMTRLYA